VYEQLKKKWKELIETDEIDDALDFFQNGGDSFKATLFISYIKKQFNVDIEFSEFLFDATLKNTMKIIRSRNVVAQKISPVAQAPCYICSNNQRSMYIMDRQYIKIGNAYHLPMLVPITGKLDIIGLNQALNKILEQEEIFRTNYKIIHNDVYQFVQPYRAYIIKKMSVDIDYFRDNIHTHVFSMDLEKDRLFHIVFLIDQATGNQYLFVDFHHICSDGVSINMFFEMLLKYYFNQPANNSEVKYKDFSVWQRNLLASDAIQNLRKYWIKKFEKNAEAFTFPTDFSRPTVKSFTGIRKDYDFERTLIQDAKAYAKNHEVTPFIYLLAAFLLLSYKYTSQQKFCIGTMSSGRHQNDIENMYGMFINTLPFHADINEKQTAADFLQDVRQGFIEAYDHQDYPFSRLVEDLNMSGNTNKTPFFEVGFLYQNMGVKSVTVNDVTLEPYEYHGQGSKFDILFEVGERKDRAFLTVEFNTDLYKETTIDNLVRYYFNILQQMADPAIEIKRISLLDVPERERILHEFSGTVCLDLEYTEPLCQFISNQLQASHQMPAIIYQNREIAYEQLAQNVNRVAYRIQNLVARSSNIVAVLMERCPEMVYAIIGTMLAGYTFLPVDPALPQERIAFMLCECAVDSVICGADCRDMPVLDEYQVISIDSVMTEDVRGSCAALPACRADIAYIEYTSGSTGKPKGVMVTQEGLTNYFLSVKNDTHMNKVNRYLSMATISFDVSIVEYIFPIALGKTVVIANDSEKYNNRLLCEFIEKHDVSFLQITPSRLKMLLKCEKPLPACLEVLFVGGEVFEETLLEKLRSRYSKMVYNVYGPTEGTIWCSCKILQESLPITVGRPIHNVEFYILNDRFEVMPVGVEGELYIAGKGLAKGYINQPNETAARFIKAQPFRDKLLYKTGDAALFTKCGEVIITGRRDGQVKLHGNRIELNEIKVNIEKIPGISDAVVTVDKDINAIDHLACYFTSRGSVDILSIKKTLGNVLPQYMVPDYFYPIDEIPLNMNGKVDWDRLTHDTGGTGQNESVQDITKTHELIRNVWQDILQISDLALDDDVFSRGANSLLAIQFLAEMESNEFFLDEVNLFDFNSVNKLTEYIVEEYQK
jgi:amino acid adenylation domain-containing protein